MFLQIVIIMVVCIHMCTHVLILTSTLQSGASAGQSLSSSRLYYYMLQRFSPIMLAFEAASEYFHSSASNSCVIEVRRFPEQDTWSLDVMV